MILKVQTKMIQIILQFFLYVELRDVLFVKSWLITANSSKKLAVLPQDKIFHDFHG